MDDKLNKIYKKVYNVLSNIYKDFYVNENGDLKTKNPEIYIDTGVNSLRSLSNKDNLFDKVISVIATVDQKITCILNFKFYVNEVLVLKDINAIYINSLNIVSSNSKTTSFCIQEWYPDIEKVKVTYV